MLIKRPRDIPFSAVTPKSVFAARRRFLRIAAGSATALALPTAQAAEKLAIAMRSPYSTDEAPTPYRHVTSYNNFQEFGPFKEDPAELAGGMR